MKKAILPILLALAAPSFPLQAQPEPNTHERYCILLSYARDPTKDQALIRVNFGTVDSTNATRELQKDLESQTDIVDAINILATHDWTVAQAIDLGWSGTGKRYSFVTRYILRKVEGNSN